MNVTGHPGMYVNHIRGVKYLIVTEIEQNDHQSGEEIKMFIAIEPYVLGTFLSYFLGFCFLMHLAMVVYAAVNAKK